MKNKVKQMQEELLKQIAGRRWPVGALLPSIRELESSYSINKQTIHKAIQELARAGVVESRPRSGNYVLSVERATALLAQQRKPQIAFVLPRWIQNGPSNPSLAEILTGAENAAAHSGVNLIYKSLPWEHDEAEFNFDRVGLASDEIAGCLLVGPVPGVIAENFIRCFKRPVVLVDNILDVDWPNIACVTSDNLSGAAHAVRYLYERGHRRIGLISVEPGKLRINERHAGFYAEMHRLRLLDSIAFIREAQWESDTIEGGFAVGQRLLEDGLNGATAVLAINDNMALGFMQAVAGRWRVPADLAVMGIGDEPRIAERSLVPLTTMAADRDELGRLGFATLLDLIDGPGKQNRIIMRPMRLVERASVVSV